VFLAYKYCTVRRSIIVGSLRWEPTVGPAGPSRWKQVNG
jgi:hypothetical protein